MRTILTSLSTYLLLLASEGTRVVASTTETPWCTTGPERGVLIAHQVKTGGFPCYVSELLKQNMPIVMIIAVVIIVASGIQYMAAMGNPSAQGAAKQRILGVLGGVIFYFLIRYLVPLIAGGIAL